MHIQGGPFKNLYISRNDFLIIIMKTILWGGRGGGNVEYRLYRVSKKILHEKFCNQ